MRTKATACAIHNSLRAQHQPKVRLTHHDDKAGSFYWLKIIATTIAPVSMVNHHLSREKRLAMVHSYNSNIWSLPCVKFPQISFYYASTRCHIHELHIIFNGTNHHFGFDIRKKGTWRYARLMPLVAGHGICSTHFLVGRQSVSFQIPARKKIQLNWFKHHLF
jgi:hypothetical protein